MSKIVARILEIRKFLLVVRHTLVTSKTLKNRGQKCTAPGSVEDAWCVQEKG